MFTECLFCVSNVEFVDHSCAVAGCKTVIIIDGNMKNARQVCSFAELYFDGIPGSILVGKFDSYKYFIMVYTG